MNNISYIRALSGLFSAKEWQAMKISEMEIHYKSPCFEGEVLDFQKAAMEDGSTQICAVKPDGKIAIYVALK